MLNTHWMTSSAAAKAYFAKSDYYATCLGDWLGKGAEMLGLNSAEIYTDTAPAILRGAI